MEAQFYFYQQVSKSPYKTTQKKIEEGPNGFHLLKGVIFSFFLQSKNTARRFFLPFDESQGQVVVNT